MPLTDQDIELIEKALSDFEKRASTWSRWRLIALLPMVFMVIVGAIAIYDAEKSVEYYERSPILTFLAPTQKTPDNTPDKSTDGIAKTFLLLKAHTQALHYAGNQCAAGVFMLLFGAAAGVLSFMRWKRPPQNMALAKLFRERWEKIKAECVKEESQQDESFPVS